MAGLIGGIPVRQVSPRSTSTKHPKNGIPTAVLPGAPSSVLAAKWFWDEGIQHNPLGITEIASVGKDASSLVHARGPVGNLDLLSTDERSE